MHNIEPVIKVELTTVALHNLFSTNSDERTTVTIIIIILMILDLTRLLMFILSSIEVEIPLHMKIMDC